MKRMIGFLIVISCMLIVSVASALSLAVSYEDGVITYTVNDMSFPCELWLDGGNTGYGVLKNGTYTLEKKLKAGEHTLVVASNIAGRASCRFTVPGEENDPLPTDAPTKSPVKTATPTPQPTVTPIETATPTPQQTGTPVKTTTPMPQPTGTPVETATPTPQPTGTPIETAMPAPTASSDETAEPEPNALEPAILFSVEYKDGKLTYTAKGNHGISHILIDGRDTRRILSGEGTGTMNKKMADGTYKIQLVEEETGHQAEAILTIPHDVVLNWVKEPTCTEKGIAELVCLNCDQVLETKESALMMHSFTLTEENELVCTNCGEHFAEAQSKDKGNGPKIMYGELYTDGIAVPAISANNAIVIRHDDIIHFYPVGINNKEAGCMMVFWSEYSGSMLWIEINPYEGATFDTVTATIYAIGNEQITKAASNIQPGSALPLEAEAAVIMISGDGVYANTLLPIFEELESTIDEMTEILETYRLNK